MSRANARAETQKPQDVPSDNRSHHADDDCDYYSAWVIARHDQLSQCSSDETNYDPED
jgi:hypothetical protein